MFAAARTPPHIATLIVATALSIATLNLILPSLPGVALEFEADYAVVNLALAGYAAATAPFLILFGPLSDRFGRRPTLLAAFAVFVLASVGCAVAGDVWTFLAFRLLQGAAIGGAVISNAAVRDTSTEKEAARRLGDIASAWAVAPMLAPMIGGLIDDAFGWRANFYALAGAGAALWILIWADFGETHHARVLGFGAQLRAYSELLRSRRFWGYSLCNAFSVGAFYAFLGGAPIVAARVFGFSPAEVGLAIGSITAGFLIGSAAAKHVGRSRSPARTMIVGRLIACGGLMLGLLALAIGPPTLLTVFGPAMCVGFGNGVTLPSANAGAMSVRPKLAGSAAGLSGALTVGGGAVLSSASGAAIAHSASPSVLLATMLASATLALFAGAYVDWIDRVEARAAELRPVE